MPDIDRRKLLLLLNLTASDNDNEALASLRAANRLLKSADTDWETVLLPPERSVRITVQREAAPQEDWVPPHLKDKVMIDLMFRSIYSQPRSGNEGFWQWLDDIHEKFRRFGQLSPGQYLTLRKCYQRTLRTA
jgi:transcriptional regulator GlxA family with amidase domain